MIDFNRWRQKRFEINCYIGVLTLFKYTIDNNKKLKKHSKYISELRHCNYEKFKVMAQEQKIKAAIYKYNKSDKFYHDSIFTYTTQFRENMIVDEVLLLYLYPAIKYIFVEVCKELNLNHKLKFYCMYDSKKQFFHIPSNHLNNCSIDISNIMIFELGVFETNIRKLFSRRVNNNHHSLDLHDIIGILYEKNIISYDLKEEFHSANTSLNNIKRCKHSSGILLDLLTIHGANIAYYLEFNLI